MEMTTIIEKLKGYLKDREENSGTWNKDDSKIFSAIIGKLEKGEPLLKDDKFHLSDILEGWIETIEEEIQEENGWELEEYDSPIIDEIYSMIELLGLN